jgi:hypothetical protein
MEVPDDPALNPTGAITVEAWVYLNAYAGWGTDPLFDDCPMLVGKNWEESYALALGCGGDVMDSFVNGIEYYENTPTITLHTWTHVAMTYNLATRRNFQDGQPVTEIDDQEGAIGDTADPLRIGNDVSWDFSPSGRIDDVRIWNVARTQAEIAAGMNGVASDAPGLVAQWTFDGGSLVDSAGGLTGTLMGDVQIGGTAGAGGRPGDEDCNGQITIDDVPISLHRLAVTPPGPPCEPDSDDANCDGTFDAFDPLAILKHIATGIQLPGSCDSIGGPLGSGFPGPDSDQAERAPYFNTILRSGLIFFALTERRRSFVTPHLSL